MIPPYVATAIKNLGKRHRVAQLKRLSSKAAGAISAQVSQAVASLVLQMIAARSLGASGLGLFAILYGGMILGTALSSGLIGDSLTVLDRSDRPVRVALVRLALLVAVACGLLAATAASFTGAVPITSAILFGVATTVFILEDGLRRLLMATMRFWSLLLVDGTSLVASTLVLAIALNRDTDPNIGTFMVALLVGQALAIGVAWRRLPAIERSLPLSGPAKLGAVFAFGSWRALQLSMRPATMIVVRLVISAWAGIAAYGQLEAARICVAPALVIVNGIGALLLSLYASQRLAATRLLLWRADLIAAGLVIGAVAFATVITFVLPILGPLITGGQYPISPTAVLGWGAFAAAVAALTPYTSLAAVRGRQRNVTGLRVFDPIVSLVVLVPTLILSVDAVPYALAAGPLMAGIILRWFIIVPIAHTWAPVGEPGGERMERARSEATSTEDGAPAHSVSVLPNGTV